MPRVAPAVTLNAVTEATLQHLERAPSTPQGLAQRVRIVLAAAAGKTNQQIAAALGLPKVTVGKWRRAFTARGLDGLEDALRSGRPPKHGAEVWEQVQQRVCQPPPAQSRWTVRTLARTLKLPPSTVHEMLVASHLQPHRVRTFAFSPDPDFEAKLLDIVGLYLNPPENALVLCVDEKTGIQALDGTQSLLAALEVATGQVLAPVKQRRTSVNFLRFMDDVVAAFPQRALHVILDHLNIHKNDAAQRWLARHPSVHFHHTPTHASWVNLIECFFSILSKQGLSQSVHRSKRELKDFLLRYLATYNETSVPFTWTKGPEKLRRIIEATKAYQAAHPPKRKRRRKKKSIANRAKN